MTASSVPTSSRKKYASEPPKTAEQINVPIVGKIGIVGEPAVPVPPIPLAPNITHLQAVISDLRFIRDTGAFKKDGAHTFREWCMKQFGERIGGLIEENL